MTGIGNVNDKGTVYLRFYEVQCEGEGEELAHTESHTSWFVVVVRGGIPMRFDELTTKRVCAGQ